MLIETCRNNMTVVRTHEFIFTIWGIQDIIKHSSRVQEFSSGERTPFKRVQGSGRPLTDKRYNIIKIIRDNIINK